MSETGIYFDSVTIPANGSKPLGIVGDYLFIKSASDDFIVKLNNGGRLEAGQNFELKNQPYTDATFINETGSDIDVDFFYSANGSSIAINNINLAGTTSVADAAVLAQLVTMDAVLDAIKAETDNLTNILSELQSIDTKADNIADIEALLQNDTAQRMPLHTIVGATRYEAENTTTTVTTSGANSNGGVIRTLSLSSSGTGAVIELRIDGDPIYRGQTNGGEGASPPAQLPLEFPSGVSVELYSNKATVKAIAYVEMF